MSFVATNGGGREFPNIFVFKYDAQLGAWQRLREGLSLGLTPDPQEGELDPHLVGDGIDFKAARAQSGTHEEYAALQEGGGLLGDAARLLKSGVSFSLYAEFLHKAPNGLAQYTLDKREYLSIGQRLVDRRYGLSAWRNTCIMYGTPPLIDVSASMDPAGSYIVTASTAVVSDSLQQIWTVRFDSTTSSGEIAGKKFDVQLKTIPAAGRTALGDPGRRLPISDVACRLLPFDTLAASKAFGELKDEWGVSFFSPKGYGHKTYSLYLDDNFALVWLYQIEPDSLELISSVAIDGASHKLTLCDDSPPLDYSRVVTKVFGKHRRLCLIAANRGYRPSGPVAFVRARGDTAELVGWNSVVNVSMNRPGFGGGPQL